MCRFVVFTITTLLGIIIFCNLYLVIMERVIGVENPTILGYSTAIIASGSMEPILYEDDIILNHAQGSYDKGDIITFHTGSSFTTHRIIDITNSGYLTKGDANNVVDQKLVTSEDIVGRVVLTIPYVGILLSFLKTPLGMLIFIFIGLLIVGYPFFYQRIKNKVGEEEI